MSATVRPFLMFTGRAEEAITFYVRLVPDSRLVDLVRHGAGGPAAEGTVMKATVVLGGQTVMFTDSPAVHAFTFTPSFSLFVECTEEADVARLASALAEGGRVLMPLGSYGFSQKFAWVEDRFGVSWQVNLP